MFSPFRYYETVKDDERAEDEKKVREKQTKTSESIKKNKSKSNADDGDIESEKRIKKPNPKITRIKVCINDEKKILCQFFRRSVHFFENSHYFFCIF